MRLENVKQSAIYDNMQNSFDYTLKQLLLNYLFEFQHTCTVVVGLEYSKVRERKHS